MGWRRTVALLAAILAGAIATWLLVRPLSGMAAFTAGLMLLDQPVPMLLLLALGHRLRPDALGPIGTWLRDPWLAATCFSVVTIAISLPQFLGHGLANALFALPLGAIELAFGLLLWAQLHARWRTIRNDGALGLWALACGVPMTAVAVAWMLSDHLLYAPYLDVICRWDVPPLLEQRRAGLVMLVSGLPLQIAGLWHLSGAGRATIRPRPDAS